MSARRAIPVDEYRRELAERLFTHYRMSGQCMVWTGPLQTQGYGMVYLKGTSYLAHRVAWALETGEQPPELDHLCRRRSCFTVVHLEPVTHRANVLRGVGPTAVNAAKIECDRGHPLEGEHLYVHRDGRRECRTCANDLRRTRRAAAR